MIITANSTPILKGDSEWGLYDWVAWHQALIKKYNTNTVTVTDTNGIKRAKNDFADKKLNTEFDKLLNGFTKGTFSKLYSDISNGDNEYDEGRKYFGMWINAKPAMYVAIQEYSPAFAMSKIGHGALDLGSGILNTIKWGVIIGVPVILVGVGVYLYYSIKVKTRPAVVIQQ